MPNTKEIRLQIDELEKLIECNVCHIRSARTILTNEQFYIKATTRLRDHIRQFQKQLDDLVYQHEHGETIIEQLQSRVKQLRNKINQLKHRQAIEKLLELRSEISELVGNEEAKSIEQDIDREIAAEMSAEANAAEMDTSDLLELAKVQARAEIDVDTDEAAEDSHG